MQPPRVRRASPCFAILRSKTDGLARDEVLRHPSSGTLHHSNSASRNEMRRAPMQLHRGSQHFVIQGLPEERAMGLAPTTSSLGSGTKTTPTLRNALGINGVRPAYCSTRQDIGA